MIQKFLDRVKPLQLKKFTQGVRLPNYESPMGDNLVFLKKLLSENFNKFLKEDKIPREKLEIYKERVKYELDTLIELNFIDYFVMFWDMIDFCKREKILTGKGRGSSAGSLILFLLGITGLDPIKYDLLFERFISKSRCKSAVIDGELYLQGSVPDIDQDIPHTQRYKVIDYLNNKYKGKTAKISNATTLTGKILIKECGKIIDECSEHEMNMVSNLIPKIFGEVKEIDEAYKSEAEFKKWCDEHKRVYDVALRLRGLLKNKSVHASGFLISKDDITDICPLELTSDKEIVCGFDMYDATNILIKYDLLGLKTLSVIDDICQMTGEDYYEIDPEKPDNFTYLNNTDNFYGIFQLEAPMAYRICKKVKPKNLNELSYVMCLGRPGAFAFTDEFVKHKELGKPKKLHPLIDDILEPTFGFILEQEQIMKIINRIGFTLEQGYEVIKIIGKKETHKVGEWESKIKDAGKKINLPENISDLIWKTLQASASFSFNRSHGLSYSALAAVCSFLKHKHPKEFYCACLKIAIHEQDRNEKLARISNELKNSNIKLLPPNLLLSKETFSIEKEGIRFGLGGIANIGEKVLEKLKNFKLDYTNKFELFEGAKHSGINLTSLTSLIMAGALVDSNESRPKLVLESQLWNLLTEKEKFYCIKNGKENNYDLVLMVKNSLDWIGEDGKNIVKITKRGSRLDTIKKKYEPYKKIYEQNSQYEEFANYWYEKTLLGFSYSTNLKDIFVKVCPSLLSIEEFNNLEGKNVATIVGSVQEIKEGISKKKSKYTKYFIEDGTGILTAMVLDKPFNTPGIRTDLKINKKLPEEGDICAFKGEKYQDIMMIQDISIQTNKIHVKLSDLKNFEKKNEIKDGENADKNAEN